MKKLHLGCFNCPQPGWLNTDVTPHLRIARVPGLAWGLYLAGKMTAERYQEHRNGIFRQVKHLNVGKPWPYATRQFEAIFSSHMLEHLTLRAARNCLAESHRCLQEGGIMRIAVPDLDKLVSAFAPGHSFDWASQFFEANEVSEKNMHHFMYNFDSLSALLKSAGFAKVHRREYRQGLCPDIDTLDNRPESLFVEAIR